jgi:hypothetical protein
MTVLELTLTVAQKCDRAFGEPDGIPCPGRYGLPCDRTRCPDCRPAGIAGSPIYTGAVA